MLALQFWVTLAAAAMAQSAVLPDATMAPVPPPSAVQSAPSKSAPASDAMNMAPGGRELEVLPPKPAPFEAELKHLESQLKVIEAKGPSLSTGFAFRRGRLRNPAQLPLEGLGFRSIRPLRNAYYGTDDMIAGLMETCAALKQDDPDMPPLAVGDITGPQGGRIALHHSHRSGRDADLVFFWTDPDGKPVQTEEFVRFNRRGRAVYKGKPIRFDVQRNWNLVRGLLASPRFGDRVRWIFVYTPLRKLLLDYAERVEGDMYYLERAWQTLAQPGRRAGRHDNHFHIRIDCSDEELFEGCRNDH